MKDNVYAKLAIFIVANLIVISAFIAFKTSSLLAAFFCGFLFSVIVEEALQNNK